MIKGVFIQNYALIDHLDISFEGGLNIITGETGAGKSVLLGALSLLLGQRADLSSLRNKEKKCIIEAKFDVSQKKLKKLFNENDIDFQDELIIRREISPSGSSRAFVNDTPANLNFLKELGLSLIDIHSQHDSLFLNNSAYQLKLIDTFAGLEKEISAYSELYASWQKSLAQLHELEGSEMSQSKELDYLQFQFKELEESNLNDAEEQEKLEAEQELLAKSEDIKASLSRVIYSLGNGETNVVGMLAEVRSSLQPFTSVSSDLEELQKRIESCYIEMKDVLSEAEAIDEKIVYDRERIEIIGERLSLIYKLQKKHGAKDIAELIAIRDSLDEKISGFNGLEERIEKLRSESAAIRQQLIEKAAKLSAKRSKSAPEIQKQLVDLLKDLGMPNASFRINFEEISEPGLTGVDKVSFLFSANKGSEPQPLNKVASGGELSRVMLGIKSIFARSKDLPSIIFDEIDTGVSGSVADKMGKIMNEMATAMQVITITHLPQLASKGCSHFFVYKEDDAKQTYTRIRKLTIDERIVEVAKMLSTGDPTVKALENAKELLES